MNIKLIIKNAAILTIITLAAGFLLAGVFKITKTPIQQQQEKTKQEAYKKVFKGADSFSKDKKVNAKDAEKILKKNKIKESAINEILVAKDKKGKKLGYVMNITNSEGYGGDITFSFGIKKDGTVSGIEFLSISETAGLGMKAKEPDFKNQFEGKKVKEFTVTKKGAKKENEIDAISGATITSKAVTNGVNAGISYFQHIEGGEKDE